MYMNEWAYICIYNLIQVLTLSSSSQVSPSESPVLVTHEHLSRHADALVYFFRNKSFCLLKLTDSFVHVSGVDVK